MSRLIRDAAAGGRPLDDRLLARSVRLDGFLRATAAERVLNELVRRGGTGYGLELVRELSMANSTLYPTLDSLAARGLVAVSEEPGGATQHKRAPRKFITITDAGRKALEEMSEKSLRRDVDMVRQVRRLYEVMLNERHDAGEVVRITDRDGRQRRIVR